MAIPIAPLPEGARVRVVQGPFPQDPALLGRHGTVTVATEYQTQSVGVVLDGESAPRFFSRAELDVAEAPKLPPEREVAKLRRALP
jgi:hypothetical protein